MKRTAKVGKTKSGIALSMQDLRRQERTFPVKLNYESMGNLPQIIDKTQELLLLILANRGAQPLQGDNFSQKAVLAAGVQSFNLARTINITVSTGYPIQSFILLRALYERVAAGLSFRSDPGLAKKYLNREMQSSAIQAAAIMRTKVAVLLEDYFQWRSETQLPATIRSETAQQLPRMYGVLSKFSHPVLDAVPMQFYIDEDSQQSVFSYGPNERALPFGSISFSLLYFLLFVLGTLLLLEFKDAGHISWQKVLSQWENHILGSYAQVAIQVARTLEEHDGD